MTNINKLKFNLVKNITDCIEPHTRQGVQLVWFLGNKRLFKAFLSQLATRREIHVQRVQEDLRLRCGYSDYETPTTMIEAYVDSCEHQEFANAADLASMIDYALLYDIPVVIGKECWHISPHFQSTTYFTLLW
jgi:hypothetical protein